MGARTGATTSAARGNGNFASFASSSGSLWPTELGFEDCIIGLASSSGLLEATELGRTFFGPCAVSATGFDKLLLRDGLADPLGVEQLEL